MNSKKRSIGGVLAVVVLLFIFVVGFGLYTVSLFDKGKTSFLKNKNGSLIGVIKVDGVIMESRKTVEWLHKARDDKSIKAIILRIDSPGGSVGPTQEIYEEIRKINEKKPVYASMESIAASGGYYVAAATRKIFANPGTLTGSLGVIMQMMDMSKLYEFAKMKPNTIKAGKFKDIGSPVKPMAKEERALLEETVADTHAQFMEDILETRENKITKDIESIAQGQIYSGRQALELGLVDELGGLYHSARSIHDELELEGEMELHFFEKKKKHALLQIFEEPEAYFSKLWSKFFAAQSVGRLMSL